MAKKKVVEKPDPSIVKGNPTKELFISMLVKDITLSDAIGDLIDNSVDGAKQYTKDKNNLSKFHIEITATEAHFFINDNCGGIEVNVAREYAFRFGRAAEYKAITKSIGQFGIGMKRAFFKIGNLILVNSVAPKSSFALKIDVNEWREKKDNWDFKFRGSKTKIK